MRFPKSFFKKKKVIILFSKVYNSKYAGVDDKYEWTKGV